MPFVRRDFGLIILALNAQRGRMSRMGQWLTYNRLQLLPAGPRSFIWMVQYSRGRRSTGLLQMNHSFLKPDLFKSLILTNMIDT